MNLTIQVEVEDVSDKLFMKQYVGKGHCERLTVEIAATLPMFEPIYSFEIGEEWKVYKVSHEQLVRAIVAQIQPPQAVIDGTPS